MQKAKSDVVRSRIKSKSDNITTSPYKCTVNAPGVTGSSLTQKENHRNSKGRKKQDKGDQKDGDVLEKEGVAEQEKR